MMLIGSMPFKLTTWFVITIGTRKRIYKSNYIIYIIYRSNYKGLPMLPIAAISALVYLEVFVKPEKQETLICKHSVSVETGNSKVQTLSFGAKISCLITCAIYTVDSHVSQPVAHTFESVFLGFLKYWPIMDFFWDIIWWSYRVFGSVAICQQITFFAVRRRPCPHFVTLSHLICRFVTPRCQTVTPRYGEVPHCHTSLSHKTVTH